MQNRLFSAFLLWGVAQIAFAEECEVSDAMKMNMCNLSEDKLAEVDEQELACLLLDPTCFEGEACCDPSAACSTEESGLCMLSRSYLDSICNDCPDCVEELSIIDDTCQTYTSDDCDPDNCQAVEESSCSYDTVSAFLDMCGWCLDSAECGDAGAEALAHLASCQEHADAGDCDLAENCSWREDHCGGSLEYLDSTCANGLLGIQHIIYIDNQCESHKTPDDCEWQSYMEVACVWDVDQSGGGAGSGSGETEETEENSDDLFDCTASDDVYMSECGYDHNEAAAIRSMVADCYNYYESECEAMEYCALNEDGFCYIDGGYFADSCSNGIEGAAAIFSAFDSCQAFKQDEDACSAEPLCTALPQPCAVDPVNAWLYACEICLTCPDDPMVAIFETCHAAADAESCGSNADCEWKAHGVCEPTTTSWIDHCSQGVVGVQTVMDMDLECRMHSDSTSECTATKNSLGVDCYWKDGAEETEPDEPEEYLCINNDASYEEYCGWNALETAHFRSLVTDCYSYAASECDVQEHCALADGLCQLDNEYFAATCGSGYEGVTAVYNQKTACESLGMDACAEDPKCMSYPKLCAVDSVSAWKTYCNICLYCEDDIVLQALQTCPTYSEVDCIDSDVCVWDGGECSMDGSLWTSQCSNGEAGVQNVIYADRTCMGTTVRDTCLTLSLDDGVGCTWNTADDGSDDDDTWHCDVNDDIFSEACEMDASTVSDIRHWIKDCNLYTGDECNAQTWCAINDEGICEIDEVYAATQCSTGESGVSYISDMFDACEEASLDECAEASTCVPVDTPCTVSTDAWAEHCGVCITCYDDPFIQQIIACENSAQSACEADAMCEWKAGKGTCDISATGIVEHCAQGAYGYQMVMYESHTCMAIASSDTCLTTDDAACQWNGEYETVGTTEVTEPAVSFAEEDYYCDVNDAAFAQYCGMDDETIAEARTWITDCYLYTGDECNALEWCAMNDQGLCEVDELYVAQNHCDHGLDGVTLLSASFEHCENLAVDACDEDWECNPILDVCDLDHESAWGEYCDVCITCYDDPMVQQIQACEAQSVDSCEADVMCTVNGERCDLSVGAIEEYCSQGLYGYQLIMYSSRSCRENQDAESCAAATNANCLWDPSSDGGDGDDEPDMEELYECVLGDSPYMEYCGYPKNEANAIRLLVTDCLGYVDADSCNAVEYCSMTDGGLCYIDGAYFVESCSNGADGVSELFYAFDMCDSVAATRCEEEASCMLLPETCGVDPVAAWGEMCDICVTCTDDPMMQILRTCEAETDAETCAGMEDCDWNKKCEPTLDAWSSHCSAGSAGVQMVLDADMECRMHSRSTSSCKDASSSYGINCYWKEGADEMEPAVAPEGLCVLGNEPYANYCGLNAFETAQVRNQMADCRARPSDDTCADLSHCALGDDGHCSLSFSYMSEQCSGGSEGVMSIFSAHSECSALAYDPSACDANDNCFYVEKYCGNDIIYNFEAYCGICITCSDDPTAQLLRGCEDKTDADSCSGASECSWNDGAHKCELAWDVWVENCEGGEEGVNAVVNMDRQCVPLRTRDECLTYANSAGARCSWLLDNDDDGDDVDCEASEETMREYCDMDDTTIAVLKTWIRDCNLYYPGDECDSQLWCATTAEGICEVSPDYVAENHCSTGVAGVEAVKSAYERCDGMPEDVCEADWECSPSYTPCSADTSVWETYCDVCITCYDDPMIQAIIECERLVEDSCESDPQCTWKYDKCEISAVGMSEHCSQGAYGYQMLMYSYQLCGTNEDPDSCSDETAASCQWEGDDFTSWASSVSGDEPATGNEPSTGDEPMQYSCTGNAELFYEYCGFSEDVTESIMYWIDGCASLYGDECTNEEYCAFNEGGVCDISEEYAATMCSAGEEGVESIKDAYDVCDTYSTDTCEDMWGCSLELDMCSLDYVTAYYDYCGIDLSDPNDPFLHKLFECLSQPASECDTTSGCKWDEVDNECSIDENAISEYCTDGGEGVQRVKEASNACEAHNTQGDCEAAGCEWGADDDDDDDDDDETASPAGCELSVLAIETYCEMSYEDYLSEIFAAMNSCSGDCSGSYCTSECGVNFLVLLQDICPHSSDLFSQSSQCSEYVDEGPCAADEMCTWNAGDDGGAGDDYPDMAYCLPTADRIDEVCPDASGQDGLRYTYSMALCGDLGETACDSSSFCAWDSSDVKCRIVDDAMAWCGDAAAQEELHNVGSECFFKSQEACKESSDCDVVGQSCTPQEFLCDGSCWPISFWCDGFEDCSDGSDESDCAYCSDSQFQCAGTDKIQCIGEQFVCDGWPDCFDSSDEDGCDITCDEFMCSSGGCISSSKVCDGLKHCTDGSDEEDCEIVCDNGEDGTEFLCSDGKSCIPKSWLCDFAEDCADGSDELSCTNCASDDFTCVTSGVCVPGGWECNGRIDCMDGSDESDCPCTDEEFTCLSGSIPCVSASWECDGIRDCVDGSDEGSQCCNKATVESVCGIVMAGEPTLSDDLCTAECEAALTSYKTCLERNGQTKEAVYTQVVNWQTRARWCGTESNECANIAAEFEEWDSSSTGSSCWALINEHNSQAFCEGSCYDTMSSYVSDLRNAKCATWYYTMQRQQIIEQECVMDGEQYCMPIYQKASKDLAVVDSVTPISQDKLLASSCQPCVFKVVEVGAKYSNDLEASIQLEQKCLKCTGECRGYGYCTAYLAEADSLPTDKERTNYYCSNRCAFQVYMRELQYFDLTDSQRDQYEAYMQMMCLRNHNNDLCMHHTPRYSAQCLDVAKGTNDTCTDECAAALQKTYDTSGCCLQTRMDYEERVSPKQYEEFATPFLNMEEDCEMDIPEACEVVGESKVELSMDVDAPFDYVSEHYDEFVSSFKADMSLNLGVWPEFINVLNVNMGSGGGRRLMSQGVVVDFEVTTTDDTLAQQVSATFEASQTAGTLQMYSTGRVVSDAAAASNDAAQEDNDGDDDEGLDTALVAGAVAGGVGAVALMAGAFLVFKKRQSEGRLLGNNVEMSSA